LKILEYFENNVGPWEVFRGFADLDDYVNYSRIFKYIAAPRGNGLDTHRLWETLYRGAVPVVKRSAWSQSIIELGIPMVQLQSWDFDEFVAQTENVTLVSINPESIPLLWMEYWERAFGSDIK
jgi:hypothetical protein